MPARATWPAPPAPLLILPVEDALGLEEQANLPGTLDEHPNWRRRWASHANDLLTSDEVRQRLAALAHTRKAISQGKPSRSGQFGKSTHE